METLFLIALLTVTVFCGVRYRNKVRKKLPVQPAPRAREEFITARPPGRLKRLIMHYRYMWYIRRKER